MHCSSVSWEISLLYIFIWNCTWFGPKEPIKVQNFRLLTAHVKLHQICTLIDFFQQMLKVYKILGKKSIYRESHDPEDWWKIWRKLTCCFKNDRNLVNLNQVLEISKICTFLGSYCAKYLMFDLKSTEELSFMTLKSEEKTTCRLEMAWRI